MHMRSVYVYGLAAIVLAALVLGGCSGSGDAGPRKVVLNFFGAMEKNDQATLARLLDLPELMRNTDQDYALQSEEPRVFTNPKDILDDLTGEGKTKQLWFSLQRVVNQAEILGDHATVEVTFVDKQASRGYMTKFGLHKVNEKWKIYTFKTVEDAPGLSSDEG